MSVVLALALSVPVGHPTEEEAARLEHAAVGSCKWVRATKPSVQRSKRPSPKGNKHHVSPKADEWVLLCADKGENPEKLIEAFFPPGPVNIAEPSIPLDPSAEPVSTPGAIQDSETGESTYSTQITYTQPTVYSSYGPVYTTVPNLYGNAPPVPEPGTWVLLGLGLICLRRFGKKPEAVDE